MEKYTKPVVQVEDFATADVVTTSIPNYEGDMD